jgi:hypothetical protein
MSRRKQKTFHTKGMSFNETELRGILKYLGVLVVEMHDYDSVDLQSFKNEINSLNTILSGES